MKLLFTNKLACHLEGGTTERSPRNKGCFSGDSLSADRSPCSAFVTLLLLSRMTVILLNNILTHY